MLATLQRLGVVAVNLVKFRVKMATHKIETHVNRRAPEVFGTWRSWTPAANVACSLGATSGTSDVGRAAASADPEENPWS